MSQKLSKKGRKIFETCYSELKSNVFWYINKKINNQELAEDMTADVFMKLLRNEHVLLERTQNGVKAWLFTVARNQMIDYFRKSSRSIQKVDLEPEILEISSSHEADYLTDAINEEQLQLILDEIDNLSDSEKEVLTLRYKEDFQFKEIASIVGKNEGAVKMVTYRALKKIKKKINI